jgi:hypothetical protein
METCQSCRDALHASQVDLGVLPIDEVVKLLNQTALLVGYLGKDASPRQSAVLQCNTAELRKCCYLLLLLLLLAASAV